MPTTPARSRLVILLPSLALASAAAHAHAGDDDRVDAVGCPDHVYSNLVVLDPQLVGLGPAATALGDFDGDGDEDLVVVDRGGLFAYAFEDGAFSTAIVRPRCATPIDDTRGVRVGDLDGDGREDLVLTAEDFGGRAVMVVGRSWWSGGHGGRTVMVVAWASGLNLLDPATDYRLPLIGTDAPIDVGRGAASRGPGAASIGADAAPPPVSGGRGIAAGAADAAGRVESPGARPANSRR